MHPDIQAFNQSQEACDRQTCTLLASLIDQYLPEAESRIWHRHPVWFLDGNPTVGYEAAIRGGSSAHYRPPPAGHKRYPGRMCRAD